MSNSRKETKILLHSNFIKDIENKGNIKSFYSLFIKKELSSDMSVRIDTELKGEESEDIYNNDSDIESYVLNQDIYDNKKGILSTIYRIPFELVNENLILFDINRTTSSTKGENFPYENYYWVVILYEHQQLKESYKEYVDDTSEDLKDSSGILKIKDNSGVEKYFKIALVATISSLNTLHPYIDCSLYLDLTPFSVQTRFIQKSYNEDFNFLNLSHFKEYEKPFTGHFHNNDDIESPYKTLDVINSAFCQFGCIDYFYSYCYNHNSIEIRSENIYSCYKSLNTRSFNNNDYHLSNAHKYCNYYNYNLVTNDKDINFPTSDLHENSSQFLINTKHGLNSFKEISLKIETGPNGYINWNKLNEIEQCVELKNTSCTLSHTYENGEEFVIVEIGDLQKIDLSDQNSPDITSATLSSSSLCCIGLGENSYSSSIENLYLYNTQLSKFSMDWFKNLSFFEDSHVFNNKPKYGLYCIVSQDEEFATYKSNNITNYCNIYLPNVINTKCMFYSWDKTGKISINLPFNNVINFCSTFKDMEYIESISLIEMNSSNNNCGCAEFNESFKNDHSLINVCLPYFKGKVKSAISMFEDCDSLTTFNICGYEPNNFVFNISGPADKMFKNTKNIQSLELNTSSMTSFNEGLYGSGVERFYLGDNKIEELQCSFSNMKNLELLSLNINNAKNIYDIIYNSNNIKNLSIKNSSIPISFSSINNDIYNVDNNEILYSIGWNKNLAINNENGVTIEELSFSENNILKSPLLIIKDVLDADNGLRILKTAGKTTQNLNIADVSNLIDEDYDIPEEISSTWTLYRNKDIHKYTYINITNNELRSGINWNNIYLSNKYYNFMLGNSDINKTISNNGEDTKILVAINNLAPLNKNCYNNNNYILSDDLFSKYILKMGALDLLFGSSYNKENKDLSISISPNKECNLTVAFILGEALDVSSIKEEDIKISFNDKKSKDSGFLSVEDDSYFNINNFYILQQLNKYSNNWELSSLSFTKDTSNYLKTNKKYIVFMNLKSMSNSSSIVVDVIGKYNLNGIILMDINSALNVFKT